jgi:hypothetical protein
MRKDDTSCALVGSKGAGAKSLCGSEGDEETDVGGEVDLRPVRVSHLPFAVSM